MLSASDVELIDLYRSMARARAFELAQADLWERGLISGELHLGTGEEAVAAGLAPCLRADDMLALDHRPTPVLVARGVELVPLLREMLGRDDGLCRGFAGHMHLMSRTHGFATSGIVGASAPMGAGFALAAKLLRPGSVAVATFGEGAANEGAVMETLNLAAAWGLPLVLVCKDNGWAITTRSDSVTAGDLVERARAFGIASERVDGLDPMRTHAALQAAVDRARRDRAPSFVLAECSRLDAHLVGDPALRVASSPLSDGAATLQKIVGSALGRGGGGIGTRVASLGRVTGLLRRMRSETRGSKLDPLRRCAADLRARKDEVEAIDRAAAREVEDAVATALGGAPP